MVIWSRQSSLGPPSIRVFAPNRMAVRMAGQHRIPGVAGWDTAVLRRMRLKRLGLIDALGECPGQYT